jgi:AraC-like DNA-binding protein
MVNGGVFLPQVLGMTPDFFGERLKSLSGIESRRAFLEDSLGTGGLPDAVPKSRSRECFALIESRAGQITVGELSREMGMSMRTLERVFMEEVGLAPKRVLRYLRYQAALRRLRSRTFRTQADLAYECGYSDQSHFIRDFHFFSGKSPGRF